MTHIDEALADGRQPELVVEAGDAVDLRERRAGLEGDLLQRSPRQIAVNVLHILQHGDDLLAVLTLVVDHRLEQREIDVRLHGQTHLGDARRVGGREIVRARS